MADVKMIATRESYGNTLKELAAEGHDDLVVLDADLAAATKTGVFRKAYPNRHFDCGIAEANMMGVAAGLSTMGYVPFVSSFAMFAAGRAFEQIRNSIAYPRLNVKIGATHGGISVGEDGASHQCCEDFALMRSLPGMTILCPADDIEARAAVRAAYEMNGPVYLRFGRLAVPVFHDPANYHFELGKGEQITEGDDIAIIYPQEGTSNQPDGVALIKGAAHADNARAFIDFTLSADVQSILGAFCRRPVRDDVPERDGLTPLGDIRLINYNVSYASRIKEEFLSRWADLSWEGEA